MESHSFDTNGGPPGSMNFQANTPLFASLVNQVFNSKAVKKPKNKPKAQKGFTTNLRVGDWVCLVCNNLNFSFRNECNRCQMQTKEQNQLQSLYLSENPNSTNDIQNRLPLKDLTNNYSSQEKPNQISFHMKSKSTPVHTEFNPNFSVPSGGTIEQVSNTNTVSNEVKAPKPVNKGFQNMLLVTPPKHRQNKSLNIFKEYSDSTQKELPPYKSPEHLPSISPILKDVFGYDFHEKEIKKSDANAKFIFSKEDINDTKVEESQEVCHPEKRVEKINQCASIVLKENRNIEKLLIAGQSKASNYSSQFLNQTNDFSREDLRTKITSDRSEILNFTDRKG